MPTRTELIDKIDELLKTIDKYTCSLSGNTYAVKLAKLAQNEVFDLLVDVKKRLLVELWTPEGGAFITGVKLEQDAEDIADAMLRWKNEFFCKPEDNVMYVSMLTDGRIIVAPTMVTMLDDAGNLVLKDDIVDPGDYIEAIRCDGIELSPGVAYIIHTVSPVSVDTNPVDAVEYMEISYEVKQLEDEE